MTTLRNTQVTDRVFQAATWENRIVKHMWSVTMFYLTVFVFMNSLHVLADDLQCFEKARLVSNPSNDGDSFCVAFDGKQFLVRLYFIDCPETSADSSVDAQRVREQTRYFGVSNAVDIIRFGREAKKFTEDLLSLPFTIYTVFATAPGRSKKRRIYAFIMTSSGNDLASLLVANGYARVHGIGRQTPGSVSLDETRARLSDLEMSAMMKRKGIWANSDPDRIVQLRADQRLEEDELRHIQDQVAQHDQSRGPINLNKASKEELELIKGIGPVLAKRIVAARPYKTMNELLKIQGIGEKKFESICDYLTIE